MNVSGLVIHGVRHEANSVKPDRTRSYS
jgi:hypothetical protein